MFKYSIDSEMYIHINEMKTLTSFSFKDILDQTTLGLLFFVQLSHLCFYFSKFISLSKNLWIKRKKTSTSKQH